MLDTSANHEDVVDLPKNLLQLYSEALALLENEPEQKWTVLEDNPYSRVQEIDLGNDLILHVDMFYAI